MKLFDRFRRKKPQVEKASDTYQRKVEINTAYTDEHFSSEIDRRENPPRGVQIYLTSQSLGVTGRTKDGRYIPSRTEYPYFKLSVFQRNEIFKCCSPVFGVVSSRMNRISSMDFNIVPIRDTEDMEVDQMKSMKEVYEEYKNSMNLQHLTVRASVYNALKEKLLTLLPDMSNFDAALLRWKKTIKNVNTTEGEKIKEWLLEPNQGVTWENYVKKWVFDLMIHGAADTYKQSQEGILQNFDVLLGGSVFKLKNPYFSGMEGYIQAVYGHEPQIFFSDEISHSEYLPTSIQNHPMIPLEALINKIAESLFFDQFMAERADGTKPPEKAVIVTDNNNPFKDFDKDNPDVSLDPGEQKRIEDKLNSPIQNGIVVLSGNQATILDLSKADTMGVQNERQKDIREEVALVFNMSNMEVNLTGSGDTSGRATSESQAEIEQGKGIAPIVKHLENKVTKDLITARYGYKFKMQIAQQKNEKEEKEIDRLMLDTGEMTQNEIREKYGKHAFGPEYDKPREAGGQAGEDQFNPMFSKVVE